jgi:hypothetical protein
MLAIILDDCFAFRGNPQKGEQRAASEWLKRNPNISLSYYASFGPAQRAFIVHIKV